VPDESSKPPSTPTLGWLEQLYYESGNQAVVEAVKSAPAKDLLTDFSVTHKDEGADSVRLEMKEVDRIGYVNFSPPALWGIPVTVLRMNLDPEPTKESLLFHGGEELIVPVVGKVRYKCMWSPGGSPIKEDEIRFAPGEIGAINPSVPHHGWAEGPGVSAAWLFLHHNPDSTTALDVAASIHKINVRNERRRVTPEELESPGAYSLIAWSLADRVRTHRQRADLTIHQLADLANLDPSHISRLESGTANLSLDALYKICQILRIDLRSLLFAKRWFSERANLSNAGIPRCAWEKSDHITSHMLHPRYFKLKKGASPKLRSCLPHYPDYSSWVILEGQAILELNSDGRERFELLNGGDVLHFRRDHELKVRVMKDCRIVTLHLGPICPGIKQGAEGE
jgi:transcriptional regulator with XRE-family HTH domain